MNEETSIRKDLYRVCELEYFRKLLDAFAVLERLKLIKSKAHSVNYMNTERGTIRERYD